jgi:hypothetical protein
MSLIFCFSALALVHVLSAFSLASPYSHGDTHFSNANSMILARRDPYFFFLAKKTLSHTDNLTILLVTAGKNHASRSVMSTSPILFFVSKILPRPLSFTVLAIFCVVQHNTSN